MSDNPSIPITPELPEGLLKSDIDDIPVDIDELPVVIKPELDVEPQPSEPVPVEGVEETVNAATTVEEGSIWDNFDELYQNPDNFSDLQPMLEIAEPERGIDLTLSPTTADNLDLLGNTKEIKSDEDFFWMISAQNASLLAPPDRVRFERINRDSSDWTQAVKLNPSLSANSKGPDRIGFLVAKVGKAKSAGEELSGQTAVDRFMQGTTLGSPVIVPLVNTGIWVKLSPGSTGFLAELDRSLAYARVQAGLDFNGLYGSSDDLIFREIINEAALKLITASNYVVNNPLELREIIDDEDRATLAWALAKVLYPKGIMISIPCLDPKCGNISTFRANPARMHVIDRSKLNARQHDYLSRGLSRAMTLEDIEDYKSQFAVSSNNSVRIMGREFIFRSPTIAEKIQIGRSYLSAINLSVDEALASTPDDDMKRSNIMQQSTGIEQAARYSHYIKEIRVYNDNDTDDNYSVISDEDDIKNIMRTLGNSPEYTEAVMEGIERYLIDLGASIVCYPNIPCTRCNHDNVPEKVKNKLLLPFDAEAGFFILAQRKISLAGGNLLTDLTTFGVGNLVQTALDQQQSRSLEQSIL